MEQLASGATMVVRRGRELAGRDLRSDLVNNSAHLTAQLRRERHPHAASRPPVPDVAVRYLDIEHLFETQRLGAKLQVRRSAVPGAGFVLDRTNATGFDLNGIGAT